MSTLIEKKIKRKSSVKTSFDEEDDTYAEKMYPDKHAMYKFILNIFNEAQVK